jgi:hypothetical protein
VAEIQEIEVKILPDGQVQLAVRGVKGPRCREITAGLERLLGGALISCEPTAEFNEAAAADVASPQRLEQQDRI